MERSILWKPLATLLLMAQSDEIARLRISAALAQLNPKSLRTELSVDGEKTIIGFCSQHDPTGQQPG